MMILLFCDELDFLGDTFDLIIHPLFNPFSIGEKKENVSESE